MGGDHYRFRLSEIVRHSWIHKLRSKNRGTSQAGEDRSSHVQLFSPPRKSEYFSRDLEPRIFRPSPPEKTSRRSARSRRTTASQRCLTSANSTNCNRRVLLDGQETSSFYHSVSSTPGLPTEPSSYDLGSKRFLTSFDRLVSWSKTPCRVEDTNEGGVGTELFGRIPAEIDLRPIVTKPQKVSDMESNSKRHRQLRKNKPDKTKESSWNCDGSSPAGIRTSRPGRKPSVSSHGVKLRVNSPKLACRRPGSGTRSVSPPSSTSSSSLSESFAMVKSSFDPYSDFRESMVEMIVENDIWSSKDMEDLLVCYLSLNSNEYHDLIIKVFKQIWVDLLEH